MQPTRPGDWFVAVLTTCLAAIPLAIAFAHTEFALWLTERPGSFALFLATGFLLASIGAYAPSLLPVGRFRASSPVGRTVAAIAMGTTVGLIGAAAGFFTATMSPWASLIWFPLGAFVLRAHFAVVPRKRFGRG